MTLNGFDLESAIRHCEEVADYQEHDAELWDRSAEFWDNDVPYAIDKAKECRRCAEEHRQLAEWLKDYKRLLAIESGIDVRCGNCKHDGIDSDRCNECYWYSKWEEESD